MGDAGTKPRGRIAPLQDFIDTSQIFDPRSTDDSPTVDLSYRI
jgi:hypothetical protein